MTRSDLIEILESCTVLVNLLHKVVLDLPPNSSMPYWAWILMHRLDKILQLPEKVEMIMATQAEVAATLQTINSNLTVFAAQFDKARNEIITKIQVLTDAVNSATVTPEVQSAVDSLSSTSGTLQTLAQTLDDIVPDQPPVESARRRP